MKSYIAKIKSGKHLSAHEMADIMTLIMSGRAPEDDMGAFLLALRAKGTTVEEITSAACIMRKFALKVKTKHKIVLDTCGTGGDRAGTFNISTIVALIVASAGVAVAKHGNRSVSSRCGSADILEALGVKIDLNEKQLSNCLDHVGIAFLFAQRLHPAMRHAAPVRKNLGVETIFNLLGPLTNPAGATHQMIGIYDKKLVEPIARVLKNLGSKRAVIVHGSDGLDEITTTGVTFVSELDGKNVFSYSFSPTAFNVPLASPEDLKGGDLKTNVRITKDILNAKGGPKRDIVLLNAAYALYIAEKTATVDQGLHLAAHLIDSGKPKDKLEELKDFTQSVR